MEAYLVALTTALVAACLSTSPILILAGLRRSRTIAKIGMGALVLFVLDAAAVHFPRLLGMTGIAWAVSGKFFQILAFFLVAKWLGLFPEAGRPSTGWQKWVAVIALVTLLPSLFTPQSLPERLPSFGWGLYQASLPGLAEEFIYRGVILLWLDRGLGRSVQVLGTKWGLGAFVVTVHFFLAHCFAIGESGTLQVEWKALPDFTLYSLCMCWLRYRFQSIWPSVAAHNLHNLGLSFSPIFFR